MKTEQKIADALKKAWGLDTTDEALAMVRARKDALRDILDAKDADEPTAAAALSAEERTHFVALMGTRLFQPGHAARLARRAVASVKKRKRA